jgi:hypothetical protein
MPDDAQRRYQVFVSSTFLDLQRERQKVVEAILELEAFPAGMELFPAANDEQWPFIQRQIDSSDYYVVILGGRYGSLARDSISFTEKEYDYAVGQQIPVIAFLVKDLSKLESKQKEYDPHLSGKLLEFRRKVTGAKLVKFFENPDELKSQVLQALTKSFRDEPRKGWIRARTPPGNAPRLPTRTVVRDILRVLSRGHGTIEELVYVVMSMDNETASKRFALIVAECERLGFLAVHLWEVRNAVPKPLDTIHDLIGRANLVIFDLSRPDPDVMYQLGVQRGYGEMEEEAVLLISDDPMTQSFSYAPFRIHPISGDTDLQSVLYERLQELRS